MGTHNGTATKAPLDRTAQLLTARREPASPARLLGDGGIAEGWQVSGKPETVKIAFLVRACSPRSGGEDPAHVEYLAEVEGPLPPILVHRATMHIIDGCHRVSAALSKGSDEIEAYLLDGPLESAFIVAVEANITHGLPLSLSDRRAAVAKILQTHAHWSDRTIATSTGVSGKTVAAIRCASAGSPQLHSRLGKDGRVRPLNAAAGRQLAADLISSRPDASLREIAEAVGISPSTVRDVRARLRQGEDPVPAPGGKKRNASRRGRPKPSPTTYANTGEPADVNPVLLALCKDPTLRMNDAGRELLRWLHQHAVNSADSQKIPDSVPDHCVDHLIEVARRCSANWAKIAHDWATRSQGDPELGIG